MVVVHQTEHLALNSLNRLLLGPNVSYFVQRLALMRTVMAGSLLNQYSAFVEHHLKLGAEMMVDLAVIADFDFAVYLNGKNHVLAILGTDPNIEERYSSMCLAHI